MTGARSQEIVLNVSNSYTYRLEMKVICNLLSTMVCEGGKESERPNANPVRKL